MLLFMLILMTLGVVSSQALTHIIKTNPRMRCLKATCCRNLYQFKDKSMPDINSSTSEDLFRELGSQEIISSGWPGLTLIHFENCGKVTAHGVSSLFNCKAVEDLLLRHNGRGIGRNVIYDAASKLPLLLKLALDLCDACDGGFDGPNLTERLYMRNIRISRYMAHKCGVELQSAEAFKPVHKETIVMEWTCGELRTIIVKERI